MPLFNVRISLDVEDDIILTPEQAARHAIKLIKDDAQCSFIVTDLDTSISEQVVLDS